MPPGDSVLSFVVIVDIVGVVSAFLRLSLRLRMRLVCGRWATAVSETLRELKGCWGLEDAQLERLVAAFPELRTVDLSRSPKLSTAALRHLAGLAGLSAVKPTAWGSGCTDAALVALSGIDTITALEVASASNLTQDGVEALARLPRLATLRFGCCKQLNDERVAFLLTRLRALKSLSLAQGASLSVAALTNAETMKTITDLDLSTCRRLVETKVAGLLPSFSALQTLSLADTQVSDSDLSSIAKIVTLVSLDISGPAEITAAGIAALQPLQHLASLGLGSCDIGDDALETIGRFGRLERLQLSSCKRITEAGLSGLRGLRGTLKQLDLRWCRLVGDDALFEVAELTLLEELLLWGCRNVSDVGVAIIAKNLDHLRKLDLGYCAVSDVGLEALGQRNRLELLTLCGCTRITATGMTHLRCMKRLRWLDVKWCDALMNSAFLFVGEMTALEELSVEGCKYLDEGFLRCLFGLHDLRTLIIQGNPRLDASSTAALEAHIPGLTIR